MLKPFCIAATVTTAVVTLLPFAPKIAKATGCYLVTPDGWRIDLSSLCKSSVPVHPVSQVQTYSYRNQWGLGLDIPSYCQQKYGSEAAAVLQENNVMGWRCLDSGQIKNISFPEACSMQYGPFARPGIGSINDVSSWHCRMTTTASTPTSGS